MRTRTKKKGFGLDDLRNSALAMVVLIIVVAIGAQIISEVQDTQTAATEEYNITGAGLTALLSFSDWFSIIVIVIVAAVIIGLILFAFTRSGGATV